MSGKIWSLTGLIILSLLTGVVLVTAQEPEPLEEVSALGTGFTYQGQLKSSGEPVNGACDFRFSLWDAASGGTQVGVTQTKVNIPVSSGYFTIPDLDFGSGAFQGDARWLAIAVRCPAGSGSYTDLSPRQALTAAPYALALPGLWTQQNAVSPNVIGGYSGNSVSSGVVGATVSGGGASGYINRVTDNYGTVGGGYANTASGGFATVGGGYYNAASGGFATVGGGYANTASDHFATIGGGDDNTASGIAATVGGGYYNAASADYATIAGGGPSNPDDPVNTNNRVTDEYGTIGGGGWNRAGNGDGDPTNAPFATVSGGRGNTASGFAATVPGGIYNTAQGDFSFAAGRRAKAMNPGCFVLADATDADEPCINDNRFVFRVTNGFYIWTTVPHTAGVLLPTGGNAWSPISDRAAKENFEAVDGREILERLASVPVETWNLKSQDASIRHIGPMAQDFYAAFGVGEDDRHISTVDADGVALAAIQGLYSLVQEKDGRIAQLEKESLALQERLDDLERRIASLEEGGNASGGRQPLGQSLQGAVLLLFCLGSAWAVHCRTRGNKSRLAGGNGP